MEKVRGLLTPRPTANVETHFTPSYAQ